ncbi:5-(carboxyamino)imidazole ribonucleotide mutase [Cetobacterium sp. SF1]|uniref:5-(carboxyamino)imidazole ribonucleotide mutase n=1 Tax=Cetobacterium sp. SF1 TaxID=3417654 RepID=UPI003CFA0C7B
MKVGVIMGSRSDYPVMEECLEILKNFGIAYECRIVSAHRTPEYMVEYGKRAEENGIDLIIAGAGGAAHLPGMVASLTSVPVIGVPIKSRSLEGMDSLLSIVQMPGGVPVATMAINGSKNAGILAGKILGIGNKEIRNRVKKFMEDQREIVLKNSEVCSWEE